MPTEVLELSPSIFVTNEFEYMRPCTQTLLTDGDIVLKL
jgi:hypothetical protein